VPWDKSNTFWDAPSPGYSIFRNIQDGLEDHRNRLVLRALEEPDLLQLYLDTLLECATFAVQDATPDQPGWLEAEVGREYGQIREAALADPLHTNDQFEQSIVDHFIFVRQRPATFASRSRRPPPRRNSYDSSACWRRCRSA
jgi:hypothetical protein